MIRVTTAAMAVSGVKRPMSCIAASPPESSTTAKLMMLNRIQTIT